MAGKSVKRVKIDASSSKTGNDVIGTVAAAAVRLRTAATASDGVVRGGRGKDTDGDGDQRVIVGELRAQLEAATNCIEQLRREKDCEARRVRDEEQARSSLATKELETRLKTECRREVERARESVRARLETDTARLVGRYERTVKRLSGDLDRTRNELREEIEKRGMSRTTRDGFDAERGRLIAEVRDLKAAKRRLEETIESHVEVGKQRTAELKRTQEANKAELARSSKEANAEIRKLLEELKAKDHQLALMDRNQYSDRGASLPKHHVITDNSNNSPDSTTASKPEIQIAPPVENDVTTNSDDVEKENKKNEKKISSLEKDVARLNEQLATCNDEKTSLNSRLEELQRELVASGETIAHLKKANGSEKTNPKQTSVVVKSPPKAVRFLLPGSTSPVLAREISFFPEVIDDDKDSVCSEMTSSSWSSVSPDITVLYDENIEQNYHILLSEHLNLQRSIGLLLTSGSAAASSTDDQQKLAHTCNRQDCIVEKDSIKIAADALKEKYELNVYQLEQQLRERQEQNEELEFRVLELEECAEKCKMIHGADDVTEELLEKTRKLEEDVSTMKDRIAYYRTVEEELTCLAGGGGLGLRESVALVKRQLDGVQNHRLTASRLEVLSSKTKTRPDDVNTGKGTASSPNDVIIDDEMAALLDGTMNSSMSTTSGFDDDVSCASSVPDEMPCEETWAFDDLEHDEVNSSSSSTHHQSDDKDGGHDVRRHHHHQQQQQVMTTVARPPTDGGSVRKSDEQEVWLARIEKAEARLAQAIQSEQQARDQMALLGEEKDRRITALEEQVDVLEANQFRLSETIRSLERLEQTFSSRLVVAASGDDDGSRKTTGSTSSSSSQFNYSSVPVRSGETVDDDDDDVESSDRCFRKEKDDDVVGVGVAPEIVSEERVIRDRTGAILNESLEKLRQAEVENEVIDKRIRDLGDEMKDGGGGGSGDQSQAAAAAATDDEVDWNGIIVDFGSEYRDLEVLLGELKHVLLVETTDAAADDDDGRAAVAAAADNTREDFDGGPHPTVVDDDDDDDLAESVADGLCASCSFQTTKSAAAAAAEEAGQVLERSREFETAEKYLTQQVKALEHECRELRETIADSDAVLRELGIRLVELQSSEQSLRQEVGRLRAKEDWLISRNDEQMELVGRLEESARRHRSTEIELRSRCERHCAAETERSRELENVHDELRAVESRYRRWIGQLDDEKFALRSQVEQLNERNAEFESREAGLLCRIRKLEAAERGLRAEVIDLERSLGDAVEERDALLTLTSATENDVISSAVDNSTQSDDVIDDVTCLQAAVERAEFFKEMLEFTEQSYAGLESRLADTEASRLATEAAWSDRTAALEADKERMAARIVELQTALDELNRESNDVEPGHSNCCPLANNNELIVDKDVPRMKRDISGSDTTMAGSNENADPEMVFWTAVEAAKTVHYSVDESALASPIWSDVETLMGISSTSNITNERDDDDGGGSGKKQRRSRQSLSLTLAAAGPLTTSDSHRPPPLPLSPPPESPTRDDDVRDFRSRSVEPFITSNADADYELRWKRASSEDRDERTGRPTQRNVNWLKRSSSGASDSDSIMERIKKSREFWSARSLSTPDHETPDSPAAAAAGHHRTSSTGRPSLIPRINHSLTVQRTVSSSEHCGATGDAAAAGGGPITMPLIRSMPSPHLSPQFDDGTGGKRNVVGVGARSFIPRPINEYLLDDGTAPAGSDAESSELTMVGSSRRQGGHRDSTKIYTTVLFPNNRFVTSKFSYLSGSSLSPRIVRTEVLESRMSPTTASSSGTSQHRRSVVTSTASGPEVPQLPGSRA